MSANVVGLFRLFGRRPRSTAVFTVVLAAVVALVLAGCSAHRAQTSASAPADMMLHHDLAYGPDPLQRLDVYGPAGAHDAPILLMVHGGGWARGDKAAAGVVENKVAHYVPAGYVVVSTNYRLSPQVDPPTEAHDVAAAMKYVQSHAADWGADPHRIVLMGHSAGANLVSLITADPSYREQAGAAPWLATISLDSAAYDVPQIMGQPHLSLYDPVFDHSTALQQASSPTLVISGTPEPMLLVCDQGRANACPQAQNFSAAVQSHGSTATVFPIDLTHAQIDSEVGAPGPLTTEVDHFLHSLGLPS